MKPFPLLLSIAAIASVFAACSGGAPRAPSGLVKRPANSPETIAQLRAQGAQTFPEAKPVPAVDEGLSMVQTVATSPQAEREALLEPIIVSDANAPSGPASLPDDVRQQLISRALAAKAITLHAYTDQTRRTELATRGALTRGVRTRLYLIDQGVPEARIRLLYRSTGGFVTPNRTPDERATNRRVEIIFSEVR